MAFFSSFCVCVCVCVCGGGGGGWEYDEIGKKEALGLGSNFGPNEQAENALVLPVVIHIIQLKKIISFFCKVGKN